MGILLTVIFSANSRWLLLSNPSPTLQMREIICFNKFREVKKSADSIKSSCHVCVKYRVTWWRTEGKRNRASQVTGEAKGINFEIIISYTYTYGRSYMRCLLYKFCCMIQVTEGYDMSIIACVPAQE